jgi:hypothetical protein
VQLVSDGEAGRLIQREPAPRSVGSRAVTCLRHRRAGQELERGGLHLGRPVPAGDGHAFTREDGAPLHPASVTARFEKIAFGAGPPPIRLHDLRHGAASLAFASGADMKAVQAMLRHSSMAITADTYTSVLPEVAADRREDRRDRAAAGRGRGSARNCRAPLGLPWAHRALLIHGGNQVPAGKGQWGAWGSNPEPTD